MTTVDWILLAFSAGTLLAVWRTHVALNRLEREHDEGNETKGGGW